MKNVLFVFTFLALVTIICSPISAQDFGIEDAYRADLFSFNLKKASYQKNPTLSLKEEARIALYKFLFSRNTFVKHYLNNVRSKSNNSDVISKLDPEISWFDSRKDNYIETENIESIINKSKEEDAWFKNKTLPVVYFSLANINLDNVMKLRDSHKKIYEELKSESENLVKLGRADANLFERWFKDIDKELDNLNQIEAKTKIKIDKILSNDEYERSSAYKKSTDELELSRQSLLKLNMFTKELENTLQSKR